MTPHEIVAAVTASRRRIWLGVVLLAAGLLGHVLAAQAIGGSQMAYTHHIGGFIFLTLVSVALVGGLSWKFWRGRHDITLLIVGAVQALLGLIIYIERFRIA